MLQTVAFVPRVVITSCEVHRNSAARMHRSKTGNRRGRPRNESHSQQPLSWCRVARPRGSYTARVVSIGSASIRLIWSPISEGPRTRPPAMRTRAPARTFVTLIRIEIAVVVAVDVATPTKRCKIVANRDPVANGRDNETSKRQYTRTYSCDLHRGAEYSIHLRPHMRHERRRCDMDSDCGSWLLARRPLTLPLSANNNK